MENKHIELNGIPAAPGLAHGEIVIIQQVDLDVPEFEISDFDEEIARLDRAIEISLNDLRLIKARVKANAKSDEAEIFEAHQMFLQDEALVGKAKTHIKSGINAEKAWMTAVNHFASMMESIPDPTLSSRAVDIRDVGKRVLAHLLGKSLGRKELIRPSIIVGIDLTPSDTASLDRDLVLGFCTAEGGPTSHTAILAKSFGLPAVVGLGDRLLDFPEGTTFLIDGNVGSVIANPSEESQQMFINREVKTKAEFELARDAAQKPAVTGDGDRVEVVANIGGVEDAPLGIIYGAEGVGLFRTEFLYLGRDSLPTEEEQVRAYCEVFKHYAGLPFVVRTLDIGGDKVIPYLDLPQELNPFLGWRGVRMLDGMRDIFMAQFRALLQAGEIEKVDLRIMVPMVSGLQEIFAVKQLMAEAKDSLRSEGKPCKEDAQFGIMVEVPSAALLADRLAKHVDFFSIGTNDLTQYTLAVDRTNRKVSHLANPLNPAVLRLIKLTIDSAHAEGKWVGLCGELAGEPMAAPILVGFRLDEFSMSPVSVPLIKQVMQKLHRNECAKFAETVLQLSTQQEVVDACHDFLVERDLINK